MAGPLPDGDDVAAVLSGDGDAFARLVARHQARVAATLWRFTRDPGRVEELVQDTFVEAYMSLRSFARGRPFGPWLRKIAVRVGYRHWTRLARSKAEVPLEQIGDLPDRVDPRPERAAEMVHALLAALPPRDRLVLTLIYLEGCSVAEAAELTGWSRIMVKVQAHRARAKLKRLVGRRSGGRRSGSGQPRGGALE